MAIEHNKDDRQSSTIMKLCVCPMDPVIMVSFLLPGPFFRTSLSTSPDLLCGHSSSAWLNTIVAKNRLEYYKFNGHQENQSFFPLAAIIFFPWPHLSRIPNNKHHHRWNTLDCVVAPFCCEWQTSISNWRMVKKSLFFFSFQFLVGFIHWKFPHQCHFIAQEDARDTEADEAWKCKNERKKTDIVRTMKRTQQTNERPRERPKR